MKGFLFDENLPRRVVFKSRHPVIAAADLGTPASDTAIWEHARNCALAIVTKDADFSHRMFLASPPPWVVHLRFGNLRLPVYHARLAAAWPRIESLLPEHKLINVYEDRIEAISG